MKEYFVAFDIRDEVSWLVPVLTTAVWLLATVVPIVMILSSYPAREWMNVAFGVFMLAIWLGVGGYVIGVNFVAGVKRSNG